MESDFTPPQRPAPHRRPRTFAVQLSSTPRGARLARLLVTQQLDEWNVPYASPSSDEAALVTAELASNAVQHGGSVGRDFRVPLLLHPESGPRIEATDARADRPLRDLHPPRDPLAEVPTSGRGLLLVRALAVRWGSKQHDAVAKTVWVELDAGSGSAGATRRTST